MNRDATELLGVESLLDKTTRTFGIRTKRKGERGSPWRIPRDGEKGREGMPLTKIKKKEEEIRLITHLI